MSVRGRFGGRELDVSTAGGGSAGAASAVFGDVLVAEGPAAASPSSAERPTEDPAK